MDVSLAIAEQPLKASLEMLVMFLPNVRFVRFPHPLNTDELISARPDPIMAYCKAEHPLNMLVPREVTSSPTISFFNDLISQNGEDE